MKRTILTAYFEGVGFTMYDEITTAINLEPLEAAKYYLNLTKVYCVVYPRNNKKHLFSEHQ